MSDFFNTPEAGPATPSPQVNRGTQTVLSKAALASLILGILSFLLLGPLGGVPALILGMVALGGIKKSNGALTGKGMAIAGLLMGLVSTIFFAAVIAMIVKSGGESLPTSAFSAAESQISSKKGDEVGFGNNDKAASMATAFSTRMKAMRSMLFTGSDEGSSFSMTEGEFLTYCQVNDDSCAFIVHVPKLRKYNDEAQKSMADLSWVVASSVMEANEFEEGHAMAVGTKGIISYTRVDVGKLVHENDLTKPVGIENTSGFTSIIEPFFPDPPAVEEEAVEEAPVN